MPEILYIKISRARARLGTPLILEIKELRLEFEKKMEALKKDL